MFETKTLQIFEEINKIPRGSGNIDPIHNWLVQWAKDNGFSYKTDKVKNVLIEIPATKGYEKSPTIVIQGHMDMVCEKIPGSSHDFLKDPIEMYIEKDWLYAKDTSLGADNGIALALAFDLALDDTISHPKLEILITTEEEVGMDGANGMASDFISGKILLNVDSEDEGVLTVGCAGGCDSYFSYTPKWEDIPTGRTICDLVLDGLLGGHSGMDIDKGRNSALYLIARLIAKAVNNYDANIVFMDSGSGASNAISRRAEVKLALPNGRLDEFISFAKEWKKIIRHEIEATEPGVRLEINKQESSGKQIVKDDGKQIANFMMSLPQGVLKLSADIEDLVETSTNTAAVKLLEDGTVKFISSQRSSVMSELYDVQDRLKALSSLAGFKYQLKHKYPCWEPNMKSDLLDHCIKIYEKLEGKTPVVEVIHAGLEPGIIGSKCDAMDMISLGPTLENPHSPDERLYLPSVVKVRKFLVELLASYK